jgi:hypothetical protein
VADADITRICTSCGAEKPLSEFGKAKLGKYGKTSRCKPCVNAHSAEYRKLPGIADRYKEINKKRYLREKSKIMKQQLVRHHKLKDRPDRRVGSRIRAGIHGALRGKYKAFKTFELLGYSQRELANHIERQFLDGMSWGNSELWHIDHIRPVSSFIEEFGATEDAVICAWALPNLRPLWAKDNLHKKDKRTHLI